MVALSMLLVANFFCLLYALRYFAFSDTLMWAWVETFGISLAIGFAVVDVLVIVVRNNINFTAKILQTRRYQVIEKLIVGPIVQFGKMFRVMLTDCFC